MTPGPVLPFDFRRIALDEVELAAVDVDAHDLDRERVAQAVAATGAAADQGVRPLFEVVIVVGEAADVEQALDRELDEPAEEAEVLDADDHRVEGLADAALQVGQQLDLDQLALGRLGPALGPRAVLGQDGQLVVVAGGLLAFEERHELAVDLEVGVAADRRGEVAVVVAGQGVVPLALGGVDGLLEAAEQAVVDGVRLGGLGRLGQDALELEAALRLVDLEARGSRTNSANSRSLGGSGSAWPRRRKPTCASVRCEATASLAASMNSSMTWWLSSCEARWAPTTSPCSSRSISTSGMFSSSARARTGASAGSWPARASGRASRPARARPPGARPRGSSSPRRPART